LITAVRWIACGNLAENCPWNSFSVSLHLNVLIIVKYYR
jgi:hypothetical protein